MLCRYQIKLLAPLITPLMSDTLFGHFCWALRYTQEEPALKRFLELYDTGQGAPLLFSSAFPKNTLPRPSLPPMTREKSIQLAKSSAEKAAEGKSKRLDVTLVLQKIKALQKVAHIPVEFWYELKEGYSEEKLMAALLDSGTEPDAGEDVVLEITTANTISRSTNSVVQEGGLFTRAKRWTKTKALFDLYVHAADERHRNLAHWFLTEYLPEHGYGADASVGMGELEVRLDGRFVPESVISSKSNAQLSLSLTSFKGMGALPSLYRLNTKFGRLGGNFSFSSPTGGVPKPFKKPILMAQPGAVFMTDQRLETKPLLNGVHSDPSIRHCGVPVTLPFIVDEEAHHAFATT